MKIKHLLLATVALGATLTSCNSGSNGYTYTYPYTMLNVITANGVDTYSLGTSTYTLTSDTDADKLEIKGLSATDNFSSALTFSNLTDKMSTDGYTYSLTSTSTISGCPTPLDFTATMKGYFGNADYSVVLPSGSALYGVSQGVTYLSQTSVTLNNQSVLSTADASSNIYRFVFNEKDINTSNRTMNLIIFYAKFMENMPSMTMSFNNIPFTISNGFINFSIDSLTPNTVSGTVETPQEKFPITNVSGSGRVGGSNIYLSFNCAYTDSNGNTNTYKISSTLMYTLPSSSATTYNSGSL
jgi:hypothetical protein